MSWKPSVVLFDLGGVLFDYRGARALEQMRGAAFPESELADFWLRSGCAIAIATGRCTPSEFACGAIEELELEATPEHFLSEFGTWLRGYLLGAESLLEGLSKRVRLACLSNTNEIDVERLRTEFGIENHFEACFFSNEMGLRKPDGAAYRYVLDALRISEGDVLFLDDTAQCVEGARASGICSEVVAGPEEVRAVLAGYLGPMAVPWPGSASSLCRSQ